MFHRPVNIYVAVLALVTICLGAITESNWPLYLQLAVFCIYTVLFSLSKTFLHDRTIETTVNHIGLASQYISYFLPFYGVFVAMLLAIDEKEKMVALSIIADANLNPALVMLPFVVASVSLLFFPIQLSHPTTSPDKTSNGMTPSSALRGIFLQRALSTQVSIYTFCYCVVRIARVVFMKYGGVHS